MIISASRRTDIPSHYSAWFFNRLKEGHVFVRNPMNTHQVSKIKLSPDVVDCIVFWTKNPKPMLDKLTLLKDYRYYFQFTLTSYGKDVEENVPLKSDEVIDTFQKLSCAIGRERVIWRYDPIFFNEKYSADYHLRYFEKLARRLRDYTEKCTISFIDDYPRIRRSMASLNIQAMSSPQKLQIAGSMAKIADENGLQIDTCSEAIDLSKFGITHAKCIDDALIERIIGCPIIAEKDKNQRLECGCAASIDIGAYDTCQNGCRYCYANHSRKAAGNNPSKYHAFSPLLCSSLGEGDRIFERPVKSIKDSQLHFFKGGSGKALK